MTVSTRSKIVAILCLVGFALAIWGVNYPFVGIYNANNNYLSLAAKNYLRFGFVNLKFFPTYFAGEHFMSYDLYYLHHPILIFLLSAVPMILFRFQNWSVHATNFFFVVGEICMIYIIARQLWGQKVALWSAGIASVFPMLTFFWKYIFFEQSSLFFSLVVYYLVIKYFKKESARLLFLIFAFALISGFTDWGVLYLLLPLCIFFFMKYKKRVTKVLEVYVLGTALSLGIFGVSVYFLQNGFKELGTAIWSRSYTAELTSLSFWPVRLVLISLLRMILYFTPISVAAIWMAYKRKEPTLHFFFIFGCLNLIFLPAASWGHSYFLYYFIPFFAWSAGLYLTSIEKKRSWVLIWLGLIVFTSVIVNYLKIQQVKKQLWKYDVATAINKGLKPYETVGVVNFAGDVFENYFFHPSQPIPYTNMNDWLKGITFPGVTKAVYVCAGTCTSSELTKAESLKSAGLVTTYEARGNIAWLITKRLHSDVPVTKIAPTINGTEVQESNMFLKIYRFVRDALSVGQI